MTATPASRSAMLLDDELDVVHRMGGRIIDQRAALAQLDRDAFTLMALFEYLIGSLDVSLIALHNVLLVQMPSGSVYPVPYNFEYSGLIDASYAVPPPNLRVTAIRDRLYRGPCRTPTELEPFFAKFRAIKPQLQPLYDSLSNFDPGEKRKTLEYLDQFYRVIDSPNQVQQAFMENCLKRGLM